ncbi:MAG: hypothetical protein DRN66_02555 [Candidatus Nanohalarchaeota archaeon]|nr:MAG: hypothetical protein DRN66_02555 [Candidatus Nanohaloarchaeota archaeon]
MISKKRKGAVAIIELMIIMLIGIVFLISMTFSYRHLSNNIWDDANQIYFDVIVNYIDSSFSMLTIKNKNINYAPTVQKYEISMTSVPKTFFSLKGLDDNRVAVKNEIGETEILEYPENNNIRGYANSRNKKIILTCYTNDTGYNFVEINAED